jgi:hypothetical protein
MEKDEVYEILKNSKSKTLSNIFQIKWDRGDKIIEERTFFYGFDTERNPLLYLEYSQIYYNPKILGGYGPIRSLVNLTTDDLNTE